MLGTHCLEMHVSIYPYPGDVCMEFFVKNRFFFSYPGLIELPKNSEWGSNITTWNPRLGWVWRDLKDDFVPWAGTPCSIPGMQGQPLEPSHIPGRILRVCWRMDLWQDGCSAPPGSFPQGSGLAPQGPSGALGSSAVPRPGSLLG